jgi:hypothetical protein
MGDTEAHAYKCPATGEKPLGDAPAPVTTGGLDVPVAFLRGIRNGLLISVIFWSAVGFGFWRL